MLVFGENLQNDDQLLRYFRTGVPGDHEPGDHHLVRDAVLAGAAVGVRGPEPRPVGLLQRRGVHLGLHGLVPLEPAR